MTDGNRIAVSDRHGGLDDLRQVIARKAEFYAGNDRSNLK